MSDLFEKSIKTLELPAVLELLSRHAVSDEAKARCLRLRPVTDAAAGIKPNNPLSKLDAWLRSVPLEIVLYK